MATKGTYLQIKNKWHDKGETQEYIYAVVVENVSFSQRLLNISKIWEKGDNHNKVQN